MRINHIKVVNSPPIKHFEVSELSDLVVIAGANGSGKTRLVSQILSAFQNIQTPNVEFIIECTNNYEKESLGSSPIHSLDHARRRKLHDLLQQSRQRKNFRSSIIYFESDRSIAQVKPLTFSFEFADPDTENIGWNVTMQPFKGRWQDTQHAIFKKVITLRNQLGSQAMHLRRDGKESMGLGFSDPIEPFKEAFSKLLAPKVLTQPDLQNQRLMYQEGEEQRPVDTLSSGEREVVNIAFDFILRKPCDCIVFFDEPELHLHPELLNRLIKTLQTSGERNQFILISHSPEVIASSLDDTVIFLTKAKEDGSNQAIILKPDSETTEALSALGQSVGVVALGKKLVLIEGNDASLDAKLYSSIVQAKYPELVLVPADGRADLENFDRLNERILNRTLWGVQFFMLADRDCNVATNAQSSRFQILPRYHIENYFLDHCILAECFERQETADSWLRDPSQINTRLREIAERYKSYAAALIATAKVRRNAGNVSVKPSGIHSMSKEEMTEAARQKAAAEKARLDSVLEPETVANAFSQAYDEIERQLSDEQLWKANIPGKQVFKQFCSEAKIQPGRLKNMYIALALERKPDTFKEIYNIFEAFRRL
ncbi:hypothetical protein ACOSOMT5_P2550 [Acidiphilium sp. MT5]